MAEDKAILPSDAARVFHFPPDATLGSLYEIGPQRAGLNRCGEAAKGTVHIPPGTKLGFAPWWPLDDARVLRVFGPDDLQVLDLSIYPGVITGAHIALFEHLTGVRRISIHATVITPDAIARLASFPNLERLIIGRIGARHLRVLHTLPALRQLHVAAPLTRSSMAILSSLTHLESLEVDATRLTPAAAPQLHRLTMLTHLSLPSNGDTDLMLPHVAKLTWLKDLSLGWNRGIHDGHLKYLQDLTALTSLDLTRTRIVGDGLGALRGMAHLAYLTFRYAPLTDVALPHLLAHRRLEDLYVGGTSLTAEAAKQLEEGLPDTRVTYSRAHGASEAEIVRTERELGVTLPSQIREQLRLDNRGSIQVGTNPYALTWDLFHIPEAEWRDIEGRDMVSATQAARSLPLFPSDAACIAKDRRGAHLIVRPGSPRLERWDPMTGRSHAVRVTIW